MHRLVLFAFLGALLLTASFGCRDKESDFPKKDPNAPNKRFPPPPEKKGASIQQEGGAERGNELARSATDCGSIAEFAGWDQPENRLASPRNPHSLVASRWTSFTVHGTPV
jgi:hypothetical protein